MERLRDQLGAGAGRRGRLVAARPLRSLAAAKCRRQSAVAAALSVKMPPPPPSLAPYIDQAEKFLLIKSGVLRRAILILIQRRQVIVVKTKIRISWGLISTRSAGPPAQTVFWPQYSLQPNGPNKNRKVAKILLRCSWQLLAIELNKVWCGNISPGKSDYDGGRIFCCKKIFQRDIDKGIVGWRHCTDCSNVSNIGTRVI